MNTHQIIRRLMAGSFLRVFSIATSAIVAFFMMPFLVESLGDRSYGLWVLVGTFMGYYGVLDFGLSTATARYISRAYGTNDYTECNTIASTAMSIYTLMGCAVFVLVFGTSFLSYVWLKGKEAHTFQMLMIILGTHLALQFPLRSFAGVLASMVRYDIMVGVELFKLTARTSLIVYVVKSGYGLITMATVMLAAEVTGNLIQLFYTFKVAPFLKLSKSLIRKNRIKQLFNYGGLAFIINTTEMLKISCLPILVSALIGVQYVVIYAVATRLIGYVEQFIKNAVEITMPILSQGEGRGNLRFIRKGYEYTLVVTTIAVTFLVTNVMLYGDLFIQLWMGDRFGGSYIILTILALPIAISLINVPTRDLLLGMSKHKYSALMNIIGISLTILSAIVFSQWNEQLGIAYGLLFGLTTSELILPCFLGRIDGIFKVSTVYYIIGRTIMVTALPVIMIYMLMRNIEITSFTTFFLVCGVSTAIFVPFALYFLPVELKNRVTDSIGVFVSKYAR